MISALNYLDSLLTKRQKIILSSILLTLGFVFTTQPAIVVFRRYYFIFIFGIFAYIFSFWSLREGMNKTKAVMLLILPLYFCLSFPGFYFLFQYIRWWIGLGVAIFFGLIFYLLLLSQNVFNVASNRAIPLYRAASTANFVFTLFISILVDCVIFSFNLHFYWNALFIFLVSFPLVLQTIWAIKIEKITNQTLIYSLIVSLIIGEGALALSFWSQAPLVLSLYLNSITYLALGIVTEFTKERLNKRALMEYLIWGGGLFTAIFIITIFFT